MSKLFKVWIYKELVSQQVMNSPEVKKLLEETAAAIAVRAGEGYSYKVKSGYKRAHATVFPETPEAIRDNAENNTLLRALK